VITLASASKRLAIHWWRSSLASDHMFCKFWEDATITTQIFWACYVLPRILDCIGKRSCRIRFLTY